MRKLTFITLLAGLLAPLTPANAAESAPPIVVCYPGGPVNEADANGAMAAMLRVVERVGQWPAQSLTSEFTAKAADCRKLLAEKKPKFAITSLGLFLEERAAHRLVPVIQPKMKGATVERYQVVASQGKFKSLDELKGKAVGGTVLEEPEFIGRIVFAGKIDPATFFDLKPSRQALRALRSLDSGELDAVILNGQQSAGLASLPLKTPAEAVFTSADIPLMGLAADSKATTAEERARFAKALEGMCTDAEGKKLCDLFGVEAFQPAAPAVFEPMVKLWEKGK
ncbi:sterol transporter periplasmic substrate-binding protein BstB [Methylomagnum sp.]